MENTNLSLSRLQAAASLLPNVVADVVNSKLTYERAALISKFCTWTKESAILGNEDSELLIREIDAGLTQLKQILSKA